MRTPLSFSLLLLLASLPAHAAVVELWSFNNPAGAAPDGATSLGVNGRVATIRGEGALFTGTGLTLPGGSSESAAYVDLQNGLVSSLTDASFELWITGYSDQSWQRVFDFGSGNELELPGPGGHADADNGSYLFLSLNRSTDPNTQRLEWNYGNGIDTDQPLSLNTQHHIVVTFGDSAHALSWYLDGSLVETLNTENHLADIYDVNNWLGRSQFTDDSNSNIHYDSFTLYDDALTAADVAARFAAGPSPGPSASPFDAPAASPLPRASLPGTILLVGLALATRRSRRQNPACL